MLPMPWELQNQLIIQMQTCCTYFDLICIYQFKSIYFLIFLYNLSFLVLNIQTTHFWNATGFYYEVLTGIELKVCRVPATSAFQASLLYFPCANTQINFFYTHTQLAYRRKIRMKLYPKSLKNTVIYSVKHTTHHVGKRYALHGVSSMFSTNFNALILSVNVMGMGVLAIWLSFFLQIWVVSCLLAVMVLLGNIVAWWWLRIRWHSLRMSIQSVTLLRSYVAVMDGNRAERNFNLPAGGW